MLDMQNMMLTPTRPAALEPAMTPGSPTSPDSMASRIASRRLRGYGVDRINTPTIVTQAFQDNAASEAFHDAYRQNQNTVLAVLHGGAHG